MAVDPAVATALRAYASQPRGVRFHTAMRARTCPFGALESRVPSGARVLDVGCGHGLLSIALAYGSPGREVKGVDIDHDKLPHARRAADAAGLGNVTFEAVDPEWIPDGEWDAIVIADVLYLMGPDVALPLVQRLAGALASGGQLLVKEIDVKPAWKYKLAELQEQFATKVARITEGAAVDFVPPAAIGRAMTDAGLRVEHVPLHKGRLHPHHLIIGTKP